MTGRPWASLSTIRIRLTAALALALLPVLLLGVLQSAIAFSRENISLKVNLGAAAQRSAASARNQGRPARCGSGGTPPAAQATRPCLSKRMRLA